jgi:hypothetical protein
MSITTEEAERLAMILNRLDMDRNAAALRSLVAERDALRQERDAQANDALKWRTAIYDALMEWHDPPRAGETPKAALRRLVHIEILAVLDPAVSRPAADLVAKARRDALEEAARRLEELHRQHKYNPKTGDGSEHDTGYYRALVEGAGWIRALKGEAND